MKLHCEDAFIREHRLEGMTGLELETHRIDEEGRLAQTPHPFAGDPYIVRDFSEEQVEINTPPSEEPSEALAFLEGQLERVHKSLVFRRELLWPFSNPPVIGGEEDIPIAKYEGKQLPSYHYREFLAERYGKYKMTYSGIHFNYSFSEDLLWKNYELEGDGRSFEVYRDRFYLNLAEKALRYSWVVVALLAASPLVDNSFYETGQTGETLFTGFSSLRCSEFGYWNPFLPILDYSSMARYTASIEQYLKDGVLGQTRELYYPVRIKPNGSYTLEALLQKGISHIELRQIDLNPYADSGIDPRDLAFLKLFLIWLASQDMEPLSNLQQMQAMQNHKAAAGYDWTIAKIALPGRRSGTLQACLEEFITQMQDFFNGEETAREALAYQAAKVKNAETRYAYRVRKDFGRDYIGLGLQRAREIRDAFTE